MLYNKNRHLGLSNAVVLESQGVAPLSNARPSIDLASIFPKPRHIARKLMETTATILIWRSRVRQALNARVGVLQIFLHVCLTIFDVLDFNFDLGGLRGTRSNKNICG
mmetsp:Transcript_61812/g.99967  ORF Transcript_61812/g.99967 Transcript_61812/m.99967 type:complete len:108 (-) Transcript_61812:43-366(-)